MPVTEEQFKEVTTRLEKVATELEHLTHGNGRRGFWAVTDAVFGPQDKTTPGLVEQVKQLTEARTAELNQRIGSEKTLRQIRAGVLFIIALVGAGGTAVVVRLFDLLGAS